MYQYKLNMFDIQRIKDSISNMTKHKQLTSKDVREIKENLTNLSDYSPQLRKVGKYMLTHLGTKQTMKSICKDLKLNYGSIIQVITEHKRRGLDFHGFIGAVADAYLNTNLIAVDEATLEGALKGTARDREIYYKRTDKLHDKPTVEINTNLSLTYAIQVNEGVNTDDREKGENSLLPYIPPNKSS